MGTLSGFLVGDTPVMAQELEYRSDAMTSARNSIGADSDPRTHLLDCQMIGARSSRHRSACTTIKTNR